MCGITNNIRKTMTNTSNKYSTVPYEVRETGCRCWYLVTPTGLIRHREDGPAIEWDNGNKDWLRNGLRHRTDGPAIEMANGYKAWFISGQELPEEVWARRVGPLKTVDLREGAEKGTQDR